MQSIGDVREFTAQERSCLQLLHYQIPGFEHYDVTTCDEASIGVEASAAAKIIDLKKNLFDPLGMTDTLFYLPDSKKVRFTTVYIYSEDICQMNTGRVAIHLLH